MRISVGVGGANAAAVRADLGGISSPTGFNGRFWPVVASERIISLVPCHLGRGRGGFRILANSCKPVRSGFLHCLLVEANGIPSRR